MSYSLLLKTYVKNYSKPFWDAAKRHELLLPKCKKMSEDLLSPKLSLPILSLNGARMG